MKQQLNKVSPVRLLIIVISLGLILWAWLNVTPNTSLISRSINQGGVPMRYYVLDGTRGAPGIIIAHGFAGSQQLMLGYGQTLAQAGYAVLLLDFAGHASNPNPMDTGGEALQASLESAYTAIIAQPEVDQTRLGLVGHSMGSGAVMQAGIRYPERYSAVAALSPTNAEVTPQLPKNLYLQAGELEGRFVANAERLLEAAGGPNPDSRNGLARGFDVIPNVEHITILFNPLSHHLTLDWFNQVFGVPNDEKPYTDRRMAWYGLHLAGWLTLAFAAAPLFLKTKQVPSPLKKSRIWLGLVAAPVLATVLIWVVNQIVEVRDLGGMLVGSALGLWFLFMGLTWLTSLSYPKVPSKTNLNELAGGMGVFAFLWIAFGLMSQFTWLNWFLIPQRLVLWPIFGLACLPWQISFAYAQHAQNFWQRFALWLAQTVLICAAFFSLNLLVPGMGVLVLYIPAIPVLLLVLGLSAAAFDRPWPVAIGSAFFFGWLIAVLFPLV